MADPFDRWMWERSRGLMAEAERIRQSLLRSVVSLSAAPGSVDEATWDPPLNVVQTEGGLTVFAAVAGVDPAAVEVRLEGGALVIEGDRPPPRPGPVLRLEIPRGSFARRLRLPAGRAFVLAGRRAEHGMLVIELREASP